MYKLSYDAKIGLNSTILAKKYDILDLFNSAS